MTFRAEWDHETSPESFVVIRDRNGNLGWIELEDLPALIARLTELAAEAPGRERAAKAAELLKVRARAAELERDLADGS